MNLKFENYLDKLTPAKRNIAKEAVEVYLKGLGTDIKKILSPEDLFKVVQYTMAYDEEHFTVVFCKNSGRMIKTFEVAKGGLMSTIVDVRVILREALLCSATIIYLSHNHPSGFLKPSSEDISITNRIKEAANIMGIKVMDHLIVGNGTYYSFSDEGQI